MALNEELTWADVGSIPTGSGRVQDAFQTLFGEPTKELLPAGMSLYKFNRFGTLAPGAVSDDTGLSPWWSPTQAFKHDAGLDQRIRIAQANGVSLREWGRLTSVVKENWSSLAWLLTIELKVPVYGWFGGFKGMCRLDDGTVSMRDGAVEAKSPRSKGLPGGGTQFYVPNLKVAHIQEHAFRPI